MIINGHVYEKLKTGLILAMYLIYNICKIFKQKEVQEKYNNNSVYAVIRDYYFKYYLPHDLKKNSKSVITRFASFPNSLGLSDIFFIAASCNTALN